MNVGLPASRLPSLTTDVLQQRPAAGLQALRLSSLCAIALAFPFPV